MKTLDFFEYRRAPGFARLSLNLTDLVARSAGRARVSPSKRKHQAPWCFRGRHPWPPQTRRRTVTIQGV